MTCIPTATGRGLKEMNKVDERIKELETTITDGRVDINQERRRLKQQINEERRK